MRGRIVARTDRRPSPAAARLPSAGAVWLAVAAAVLPLAAVVAPGPWLPGSLTVAALVLVGTAAARALRCPALLAPLVGVVVWAFALTAVFLRGSAVLGIVPTPATVRAAASLVVQATEELAAGVAPVAPTAPVSFLFVAAAGALAVVLDHVVIATRLPLLGSVAVVAVGVAPAVAVATPLHPGRTVLLAVAVVLLLWTDERSRPGRGRRGAGQAAGAIAIAAAAMVAAFAITPVLPVPAPVAGTGPGGSVGIDASLRLGEDLRRPDPVEVLTIRSSTSGAQYLRAATLSGFDGQRWRPDSTAVTPIDDGFEPLRPAEGIELVTTTSRIEVSRLRAEYLPVPYAALSLTGVEGVWGLQQLNRTVVALEANSAGQAYTIESVQPKPTLEQIRAATARDAEAPSRTFGVPEDTPALITALAREITAGADTDYDAAAALQRWFRSSEFSYSLTAPVADDFDGAGVEAVARFLEVKEGYCIHYASAFTLMVRALGMPARIVVGYLPGIATGEVVDGESVYAVSSDMLHAWPEIYFEGIGWVGFEPTNSLGSPPSFVSGGSSGGTASSAPGQQTTAPDVEAGQERDRADVPDAVPVSPADATGRGLRITGVVALAAVLVLLVPATLGALRRRRRLRIGDAAASWLFVQETAIDLGIPVPASDSPRRLARRLRLVGADEHALGLLVAAVEQAAYAPGPAPGEGLAEAARRVRAGLLAAAGTSRRVRAVVFPVSLVLRPPAAGGVGAPAPQRR